MKYVKVKWVHESPDYPVMLYSELTDDMWEIRKVEVYADGRADFANEDLQSGTTRLSIEALPSLDEIAQDPQFEPLIISAAEFEHVWESAKAD